MTLDEIYRLFCRYPHVVIDSRSVEKNSIFFALKGANFNGNEFASAALEQGCTYAVVDQEKYACGDRFVLVDDVLTTLQELARLHRQTLGIPIVAITGTNGKTTTKELINIVLSQRFRVNATQGNLNNHIGVPLTLLGMNSSTEIGIVEMGANHIGEIKSLCEIAEPNYGIITNVGIAHMEGFGSFEGVKSTKRELYDYLAYSRGKVFVNIDNTNLMGMLNEQDYLGYGIGDGAFSKGKFLQAEPYMVMELCSPLGKLYVKTQLFGAYNFENAFAAATVGRFFEVDEVKIKRALESYVPKNNRSQLQKTGKNVLFLDAYNANPTSMRAAIDNFAKMTFEKKAVILGDMLELGSNSGEEHRAIISLLREMGIRDAYLVGNNFYNNPDYKEFRYFKDVEELNEFLSDESLAGYHILIKGSRGIYLEKTIELL